MTRELTHEGGQVTDAHLIDCCYDDCDYQLPADLAWMFQTNLGCPRCGR